MENLSEFFKTKGILLVQVIVILIVGIILIKLLNKLLKKIFLKTSLDNSIISFIISLISLCLYVVLIYIVFGMLDISTTGFIAALSAVALAVGLALQDTLSNLASGFIIIFTKPFKQGDFVECGNIKGEIKTIRFFNTQVITVDNKVVVLPNNQIINNNLINYTRRKTRRVEIIVPISYGENVDRIKKIIENVVINNQRVLTNLKRTIRLMKYNSSSLDFVVWCWCNADEYWDTLFDLNEEIYKALQHHNISIPFNQLDVHLIEPETKVKNIEKKPLEKKPIVEVRVDKKNVAEEKVIEKKPIQKKPIVEVKPTNKKSVEKKSAEVKTTERRTKNEKKK